MLFSLFLFLQGPLSTDAFACINGMDEDKKVDSEAKAKSKATPKGDTNPLKKREASTAETTPVKEPAPQKAIVPVSAQPTTPKTEAVSPKSTTTTTEKATISSCSSFGLMNSLWMFAWTLPFLVRFRER